MTPSHSEGDRRPYIEAQGRYFDKVADIFCQPLPEPVKQRLRRIVQGVSLNASSRILDVGTGTGALIPYFIENGASPVNIVGVDLSREMLRKARARFPQVSFVKGDIVDLSAPHSECFPSHIQLFDFVFFNGCFGNMFDQQEALAAAVRLLDGGGQIVISHPLGARFVNSLHRNEPHIVPHRLPEEKDLENICSESALKLVHSEIGDDFYLVVLQKTA